MSYSKSKQHWRHSKEYRIWRTTVIRRDKVCQICGSRQGREAHHMNSASYFPDEHFDIKNGVTLCSDCHTQFHCNFKRSFRQKCTKYDFENFRTLVYYLKDKFSNHEMNK